MKEWQGKKYWLVGASDGLGAALAHQLSRSGVEVILSARSEDKLANLVAELPGRARYRVMDVTSEEDIAAAVAGVVEAVGREPEVSNADGLRHHLVKGVQDRAVRSAKNLDAEPVCRAVVDLASLFIDCSRTEEINTVIDPAVIGAVNSG